MTTLPDQHLPHEAPLIELSEDVVRERLAERIVEHLRGETHRRAGQLLAAFSDLEWGTPIPFADLKPLVIRPSEVDDPPLRGTIMDRIGKMARAFRGTFRFKGIRLDKEGLGEAAQFSLANTETRENCPPSCLTLTPEMQALAVRLAMHQVAPGSVPGDFNLPALTFFDQPLEVSMEAVTEVELKPKKARKPKEPRRFRESREFTLLVPETADPESPEVARARQAFWAAPDEDRLAYLREVIQSLISPDSNPIPNHRLKVRSHDLAVLRQALMIGHKSEILRTDFYPSLRKISTEDVSIPAKLRGASPRRLFNSARHGLRVLLPGFLSTTGTGKETECQIGPKMAARLYLGFVRWQADRV